MSQRDKLRRIDPWRVEVPRETLPGMRTSGVIYVDEALEAGLDDKSILQVAGVATMPGIVGVSMAMPDVHMGYGFTIGGVAAFDPAEGGVISPGGVGYDIN